MFTDKEIVPETVKNLKLINAGRMLENRKTLATLAQSRVPVGEVPGSVITMHVVVRPPQSNKSGNALFPLICSIYHANLFDNR